MEDHKDILNKEAMLLLGFEKVPVDFTADVMQKIAESQVPAKTLFKPAIGKKAWIGVGAFVMSLLVALWFGQDLPRQSAIPFPELPLGDFYASHIQPVVAAIHDSQRILVFLFCGAAATVLLFADLIFSQRISKPD